GFRQEDGVGMRALDVGDAPLPEAKWLRVGVVDSKDLHAVGDPEEKHVPQRLPQRLPVAALEVERIDVLVLLGRVLRVLDRPVRPAPEPFGMLTNPWMVR